MGWGEAGTARIEPTDDFLERHLVITSGVTNLYSALHNEQSIMTPPA